LRNSRDVVSIHTSRLGSLEALIYLGAICPAALADVLGLSGSLLVITTAASS